MRIAFVGCGYVADFYLQTLKNHRGLELVCVMDRGAARAETFSAFHRVPKVDTLREVLEDRRIELVANLTNPGSHYEVSRACLEAGKHVYSEKPLAMDLGQAEELVAIARSKGLRIASAPCSVLGESAQTAWRALRHGDVGKARVAYAELDDGPVHLMKPQTWRSASGAPWPCKDEYEVGCTLEHAGYYVTWLAAFFGPVRTVTSFASVLVPDKGVPVDKITSDFSVACLEHASGVVSRITCSIYAPHDHALRIMGDEGVLRVTECWDYRAPVHVSRRGGLGLRAEKYPTVARVVGMGPRRVPPVRKPQFAFRTRGANAMDFARGIAEVADAIHEARPARLSAEFSLHVNEVALAIHAGHNGGATRQMRSTFDPMAPMSWAL